MPFSSLTYSSPRCGDTCHLPTISIGYISHFSVHLLHAAAPSCASAGSSIQSLQCNSIPSQHLHANLLPGASTHLPHRNTVIHLSHAASRCSPHSSHQHTSTWCHHAPDHLLQPCNPTTSPQLPVIPASLYQSQTLHPHEGPQGLRTSPASPFMPKYFSSRQPTTAAYRPASPQFPVLPSSVFPFPCCCSVASNTVPR